MRADRLLSILLLLQVRQRMTARDLAQRLEVSERTIHRDMEALSTAGVPVVAERGVGGGWTLLDGYRTTLTGLSAAEIQALFLPSSGRLAADLGLRQASEGALLKLLASLPSLARRGAEDMRQRIHVDTAGWQHWEEDVSLLPVLQEAIWGDRKVRLTYARAEGSTMERLVDPLGLVAKGSVWYLVAAGEGTLRTYRVSRMRDARLADEPCSRPPDFDLPSYWAQSTAQFKAALPRYPVTLRVAPTALPRVRRGGRYMAVEDEGPLGDDGWTTVGLRFDVQDEATTFVLSLGSEAEVVEPRELREKVICIATGIVTFYSTCSHRTS